MFATVYGIMTTIDLNAMDIGHLQTQVYRKGSIHDSNNEYGTVVIYVEVTMSMH